MPIRSHMRASRGCVFDNVSDDVADNSGDCGDDNKDVFDRYSSSAFPNGANVDMDVGPLLRQVLSSIVNFRVK
jgi:Ni,Fe-hydrogenase I large subunit